MSDVCRWLHEQLARLPLTSYPFELRKLPDNGVYFFYEKGEIWGHGEDEPRIVRVGSHRAQGNLRSRINQSYVLDEGRLGFGRDEPKPADWSIFRKNIGRALLNKERPEYLEVWNIDFVPRKNRKLYRHLRDLQLERNLERAVSLLLRDQFSFRWINVDDQDERTNLEKHLVGTVAACRLCVASDGWLGIDSPKNKIREGKLWQVQNLRVGPIGRNRQRAVMRAIRLTESRLTRCDG